MLGQWFNYLFVVNNMSMRGLPANSGHVRKGVGSYL